MDHADSTTLPDPIAGPSVSAAALASADDLLSQLAGDDIDRLLAEAESGQTPVEETVAAPEKVDDSTMAEMVKIVEKGVDDVADQAADAATTEPAPTEADKQYAYELLTANQAKAEAEAKAAAEPPPEPAVEAPVAGPQEHPVTIEAMADAQAHAHPLAPAEHPVASDEPARPSLLLRFLQWLNWPFEAIPDVVRDALGKVALLTLFNAIAVIVYVLMFRGKHPQ